MKLPDVFQMRLRTHPQYTHSVKLNEEGGYDIKWARGFERISFEESGSVLFPSTWFSQLAAEYNVRDGYWAVVEENKVGQELPNEFRFRSNKGRGEILYKATIQGDEVLVSWNHNGESDSTDYPEQCVKKFLEHGDWKIIDHKPLTPEQLRSNVEFREQITALDQSIRLARQDIDHKDRLIKSYMSRQEELRSKLVKEF